MLVCANRASMAGVKKIICPSAWDKLNFSKEKHILSSNALWASKKFNYNVTNKNKQNYFTSDKLYD